MTAATPTNDRFNFPHLPTISSFDSLDNKIHINASPHPMTRPSSHTNMLDPNPSSTVSQFFKRFNTLLFPGSHPLKKLKGSKQLENEIATIPSRSYCIIYVILEGLVSSLPFLSSETKRGLTQKLEKCQTRPTSVSGLLFAVVFLSIVASTVTYSTGVGFDFTLLLLIAGLWVATSRYAGRVSKRSTTITSSSILLNNDQSTNTPLLHQWNESLPTVPPTSNTTIPINSIHANHQQLNDQLPPNPPRYDHNHHCDGSHRHASSFSATKQFHLFDALRLSDSSSQYKLVIPEIHRSHDDDSLAPSPSSSSSTTPTSNSFISEYHPIDPSLLYRNRVHTVEALFPIPRSTESLSESAPSLSRSDGFAYDYLRHRPRQQEVMEVTLNSDDGIDSLSEVFSSHDRTSAEATKSFNALPLFRHEQQHWNNNNPDNHRELEEHGFEDDTTQPTTPVQFDESTAEDDCHFRERIPTVDCYTSHDRQRYDDELLQSDCITTRQSSYQRYWETSAMTTNNPAPIANTDSMLWLLDYTTATSSAIEDLLAGHKEIDNVNDHQNTIDPLIRTPDMIEKPSSTLQLPEDRQAQNSNPFNLDDVAILTQQQATDISNTAAADSLAELCKDISNPLVLRGLCDSALSSFINGSSELESVETRSLFLMLAKKIRFMIKEETSMPGDYDLIEYDPSHDLLEDQNWNGDCLQLRTLIEEGNPLWSWVDHLYSTLVSSALVNPEQTWSHHATTKPPNEQVKNLLDLDILNELMSGTVELLDYGLQTIDRWMAPKSEKKDHPNGASFLVSLADDPLVWGCDDELHYELKEETRNEEMKEKDDESTVFHSCVELDLKAALQALHQLHVLFFSTVRYQKQDPQKSDMRRFVELLIRCHLLIGSEETVLIAQEVLAVRLEALSVGAVGRCLRTSIRSPVAPKFWDIVEELYRLPADHSSHRRMTVDTTYEKNGQENDPGHSDTVRRLRDSLWPILIDCRVRYKMFNEALQLLDTYSKSGGLMPQHFSSAVIQLGVECERIDLIHTEMNRGRPLNDIHQYMQVVRALGRSGDVSGALKALEQLENDDLVKPDVPAYNSVLDVCVSNGDLTAAETLFNHMKSREMLDVVSFNIMIKGHIRVKPPDLTTACKLLQMMRSMNFMPDGVSYNSIIGAAVATDRMELAWNLIDDMERSGVHIDRYTCSIMIKHLRPSSSPKDRRRTLDLMEKIDVCEDTILFSTIVDACARLKDQRRLRQALEKFHQSGLRPNVHAYGTLIKAYGRCRDVNRAWALWIEMTETRRLEPTNYTYGCMFDTLVSNGRVEEGIDLLNNSLRKGREANTVQYSILIKGCAQKKQVDEALALYQDMQTRHVPCNEVTYNTLINACASAGDLTRAEVIMQNMKDSSNCQPDVITYSTMIKGFCSQGHADRAFELFNEMESLHIQPDAIVFNTLLEGCSKRTQVDTAEEVFQKMLDRRVSPSSFTLTILIKLYGKTNNLGKALRLANELPVEFGFESDAYVYTALIAACLTNGEVNKALEFFEAMNIGETRGAVSGRTFGTVIIGCMKSCRYFGAYELLAEAHSRNLEVDPAVIQRLQQNFVGRQEELASLYPVPISGYVSQIARWLSARLSRRHTNLGLPPHLPESIRIVVRDIECEFRYDRYMPTFGQHHQNHNNGQQQYRRRPSDFNSPHPNHHNNPNSSTGRHRDFASTNRDHHNNNNKSAHLNHQWQHQGRQQSTQPEHLVPCLDLNNANDPSRGYFDSTRSMGPITPASRYSSSSNYSPSISSPTFSSRSPPTPVTTLSPTTQFSVPPPPPSQMNTNPPTRVGPKLSYGSNSSHATSPHYQYDQNQPMMNPYDGNPMAMTNANVNNRNSRSPPGHQRNKRPNRRPNQQPQHTHCYEYNSQNHSSSDPSGPRGFN